MLDYCNKALFRQTGVVAKILGVITITLLTPLRIEAATEDPIAADASAAPILEAEAAPAEPIVPVVPLEKAYRNLILLLDPHNWDAENGAIVHSLKLALSEKAHLSSPLDGF